MLKCKRGLPQYEQGSAGDDAGHGHTWRMRFPPASAIRISRAAQTGRVGQAARASVVGIAAVLVLGGCGLTEARNAAIADAKVTPNSMADSLRPGLVGMPDYPSSGWEPG